MQLARRQKLLLFKVSALLSLVRWYNIFFLALSQYLTAIFILNAPKDWIETLKNPNLHYIVFASLFCIAAGYLINNFYDVEKDLINRPERTIHQKIVRQSTSLRLYFLFNFLGALLSLMVSLNVFLFFSFFIFALWFYSHKLKKITFLGNMVAALLAITPFFATFLYYHLEDLLVLTYISFLLLIIFIREIIKDLRTFKGDVITGYPTLPVQIGINRTKWLIFFFALLGLVPSFLIFYKTEFTGVSYYLSIGLALVFLSLIVLLKAQKVKHYSLLNNIYRFLIIGGIFSLILFNR